MNNYQAAQYKGKEWGVFALDTRNWCVFGSEKRMKERAASLNAQDAMIREMRHLKEESEGLRA